MGGVKTEHAWVGTTILAVSSVLVLLGIESVLRWLGYQPWRFTTFDLNEPTVAVPDPLLGWRAKPGHYVVPPFAPGGEATEVTILPDGARSIGFDPGGNGMKVFFVGASFTQGWGVSDQETFARKVQDRLPELRIRNYGTSGYSTFQSLLFVENLLSGTSRPDWILLELDDLLEERDVDAPSWLRLLTSFSKRGNVPVPYCTIGAGGELVRHAPEGYPAWPLREHLATVAMAERVYVELRGRARPAQQREVAQKLLVEMNELLGSKGVRFTTVLLHFKDPHVKDEYAEFLRSNTIDFVDCRYPLTADMIVPDGHANAKMHTRWANCIAAGLEDRMRDLRHSTSSRVSNERGETPSIPWRMSRSLVPKPSAHRARCAARLDSVRAEPISRARP
jgi:hypothetical protein